MKPSGEKGQSFIDAASTSHLQKTLPAKISLVYVGLGAIITN